MALFKGRPKDLFYLNDKMILFIDMNFSGKRFFLFLGLLILCPALNAQNRDIRILFFSDNYTPASSLQTSFEQKLAQENSRYDLSSVEKLPAYFSEQSYIFSEDKNSPKEKAENSQDFIYRAAGTKEVIATDSAILFQKPFLDKEIRRMIIPPRSKRNPLAPKSIRAKNGIISTQEGEDLEVLSLSSGLMADALWLPAMLVKYKLVKEEEQADIYILQKPLGGIGAWFNPVQNISRESYIHPLIINTGGLERYERLSSQPAFLARYWKTMDTDAVAFAPRDSFIIYKGALEYPELKNILIASNIEAIEEGESAPFSKTALIKRNGIRIGLISLSEPGALDGAPGKGLPLKVVSPFDTAPALIQDLKENQKADLIILVSHLSKKTLNAFLERVKGIDILINAAAQNKGQNIKKRLELKDWNLTPADMPAYSASVKPDILGDISIKFTLNQNGYTPVLIEDAPATDIFSGNSFNNEFYPVNKYFFEDWQKQDNENLLPSAQDLQIFGDDGALSYSPAEIFNMAVAIIRKTAKTEVAFIRILPFKEKLLGSIGQKDLEEMLDGDEPVLKVKIKGKYLKKMLNLADFDDPFSNTKDYATGFSLAVSGAQKDGGDYKINTLAVADDEIYSAAFPESILKERLALPDISSGIVQIKHSGSLVQDMVSDYLKNLLEENKNSALMQAEEYRRGRDLRLEEGLPPQDEITEELDLKTSLQGPIAAEEYFTDIAMRDYQKQIFSLIQNTPDNYGAWRYNLRNLSFIFSNTDVKNAEKYQNFSDSRLTSDGQTLIQGSLDFAAEYYRERIRWDNILSVKYGKTTLRPFDEPKTRSENADHISLSTDYTYKSTDIKNFLGGFLIGPFASIAYQTEFTRPEDAPRYKALRGRAGLRLFEGKYLKDFSLAIAPELDFTYPQTATKYAWQAMVKIEHPVNDNAKAVYAASIRDFFLVQHPSDTDISYEFELSAKVEMELMKSFYIAPFVSYYQAQASGFDGIGSNLYLGVSLSYSRLFKHLRL